MVWQRIWLMYGTHSGEWRPSRIGEWIRATLRGITGEETIKGEGYSDKLKQEQRNTEIEERLEGETGEG